MKPISRETSRSQGDSFLDGFKEIVANVENHIEPFHGCRSPASSCYSTSKTQEIGKNRNLVMRKALGYTVSGKPWRKDFYVSLWNHHDGLSWLYTIKNRRNRESGKDYTTLSLDIFSESIFYLRYRVCFPWQEHNGLEFSQKVNFHDKIYFALSNYFCRRMVPCMFVLWFYFCFIFSIRKERKICIVYSILVGHKNIKFCLKYQIKWILNNNPSIFQ